MSFMGGRDDDFCSGCASLERQLDKACDNYERQIEMLQEENALLKEELKELRWMMEGLEK